jgi:hypothetical protein
MKSTIKKKSAWQWAQRCDCMEKFSLSSIYNNAEKEERKEIHKNTTV